MTLLTTNISTALAKAALSESTNAVRALCVSSNINEWALHKPANYGAGKDTFSVDTGEYSGFVRPIGISSNATGHRLGDFRGYNHDEFPPKYFESSAAYSYYRYETPNGNIPLRGGAMYSTSNNDGFDPAFHTLDESPDDTLTAVKAEINGTPFGDFLEIKQIQELFPVFIDEPAGSYTLTAYYYTRLTDISAWVKGNKIEGGDVTLTVTELPAKFVINSRSIDPNSVPSAGVYSFTYYYQIENLLSQTISVNLYWELNDVSGSDDFLLTSEEVEDRQITITNATIPEFGAMFRLYWDDASGQEIDNSNAGVLVEGP